MELFVELSLLIAIATGVAVVMHVLKQPLIIGHILTGLIVGPFVLDIIHSAETLALMGQFGVAILLFTVGLHLRPEIIRTFGRVAAVTGIGQVAFTSVAGFAVCTLLGFPPLTSFYVSIALAFSSTIIILKLITDKGDTDVLYARIAIGFLLVQDLIAVLLLMGIPLFTAENASTESFLRFAASAIFLLGFVYLTSRFFVSRTISFLARSQELLFLFAITWGIGIAALFHSFGFSIESGALIAGVALASLPFREAISARLTPLRDFFIIIFFIYLGAQLKLDSIMELLPAATALSVLVLVGNPLILMSLLGILGYRKKTSLQTGFTVAQVSEFSLILVALGVTLGHVNEDVLSLVTIVGIITIFGSSYLVMFSDRIYRHLSPYLGIFERETAHDTRTTKERYEVVLFGCNRIGYDFLEALVTIDRKLLVVDYDPDIVARLHAAGIATEFGDASDIAFLESLDFSDASLVISTIPDAPTNSLIHRVVREQSEDAVVLAVAHRVGDALGHYDEGLDYVILPHFLGGRHAADIILKFKDEKSKYAHLRDKHIEHLQLRVAIGHEHPLQRPFN